MIFCLITQMKAFFSGSEYNRITASMATNTSSEIVCFEGEHCGVWAASAHLRELFHHDERQPTQLQIADELIFSRGAAPVSGLHVGLTENVEQISQLILV